jgi:phosphoribosylanthranilate isomerase
MIEQHNKLLKVCKVDSISFASYAMKQKVDFIGIHVLTKEDLGEHQELNNFIKNNGGKTVIVTKINDELILEGLIRTYSPSGIQLHFEVVPELVKKMRVLFPETLFFGVLTNQSSFLKFDIIDSLFDFVIYDTSYEGGTNESNTYVHFNDFPQTLKAKTLLAGGLTSDRVQELGCITAAGYDVQSYFRKDNGLSFRNLDKLCDTLKFPRRGKISVSLTELPLTEVQKAASYYLNPHLEYHLDYSNASLYPGFNTVTNSIEEKQQYMTQLPYSMHLFIKDETVIREKIQKLSQRHSLSLTRFFIQYYKGINVGIFNNDNSSVKIIPSVFYKDLTSYLAESINTDFLSIVVPKPERGNEIEVFVREMLAEKDLLHKKEVWLDRNLDLGYIDKLQSFGMDFNFIVGKEVINNWGNILSIHEHFSKKR